MATFQPCCPAAHSWNGLAMWGACFSSPGSCSGILPSAPPHSVCFVYRLIFFIRCIQKTMQPSSEHPGAANIPLQQRPAARPLPSPPPQEIPQLRMVFFLPVTPKAGSSEWLHAGKKSCAFPISRFMAENWDDAPATNGNHWQPGKAAKDEAAIHSKC